MRGVIGTRRLTRAILLCAALGALMILAAPAEAGTVKRVSYRANDDQPSRTFFNHGGLKLIGDCDPGFGLRVVAESKVDGAMINANSQSASFSPEYAMNDDFDNGDQLTIVGSGGFAETDSNSGQIIYGRPGGKNVTVDWLAEEGAYAARDCAFVGTGRVVDGTSSSRANYRVDADDGPTTFFNQGGLKLVGNCNMSHMDVIAQTTTSDASIHANSQYFGDNADYAEDNDFDTGNDFDLSDASGGQLDDSSGQLIYARPGGTNVTIDWSARYLNALGRDCVFNGTARVRSSGDPKRVNYRIPAGSPATAVSTFFNQGGLKLAGGCDNASTALQVLVSSTKDFADIHYNHQNPSGTGYGEDDTFNADPDDQFSLFGEFAIAPESTSGQIIYSSFGGTNVTIDWMGQEDNGLGGTNDCTFAGTAEVATP
jgi:hypothetical protein